MGQFDAQHAMMAERSADAEETPLYGILAEYHDVDSVYAAAIAVRDAGYEDFDVHSPFPMHGIDEIVGNRPTTLPWIVLAGGLFGLFGGLALTIWTMAEAYTYLVSGKPYNSLAAWIPVVFECTILCASLTAVAAMLLMNKLPLLYHPLFKVERFRGVTTDRFFVSVRSRDPKFDMHQTSTFLKELGATSVELVES